MDRILRVQVSKLLSEEDTNEQVAKEAKKGLKDQLSSLENREKIYGYIR